MRLSLKDSVIDRLEPFKQEYQLTDLNDVLHSLLTELGTLRRLSAGGLCRYAGGPVADGGIGPNPPATSGPGGGTSGASGAAPSVQLDDLSALLNE